VTDPTPAKSVRGTSDLTEGPIVKTLFLFALPALGSNVLQSINASINAVWVGQYLGANGIAATANANLIMFMMLSLVFGFAMASTILIGQSMGRGDIPNMRRAVGTGLGLFAVMGIASSVLGWLVSPMLLHALSTPVEIYPGALGYLRVMFLGLPFALMTVYFSMALRGVGDAMTPLLLQVPGMLVDIALNPVLIDGLFGLPRMGIEGAALATLIANLVSFLLMIGFIYWRDLPVRLRGAEWSYLLPRRDYLKVILLKGIPMGLQLIVMSGSAIILLGFVNAEGMAAVAAYGANSQLWGYIQMPGVAIGMAVSAMAAQNIGAGKWDRVDATMRAGVIANLVMTGFLIAITLLFDRAIMGIFLPDNQEAVEIARRIGHLVDWSFILLGTTMVLSAVPRANGATVGPLVIMIVAYLPVRMGAILALRPWLGSEAIWWGFSLGGVAALIFTIYYYRHGKWRESTLIVSIEEAEELVQSEAEPAGRMLPNG
jgi:putative MATE family efflux protein